jgi:hypothetical protein
MPIDGAKIEFADDVTTRTAERERPARIAPPIVG